MPLDQRQRAYTRAFIYRTFSAVFQFPTEKLLKAVDLEALSSALEAVAELSAEADGSTALRDSARRLTGIPVNPDDCHREYVRLFAHSHLVHCPPYETEYVSQHVFMKTRDLADIAGFYRAFGLQVADSFKDRVDHLACELEFMSFLALKELYALDAGQPDNASLCADAERKFLESHLGTWVDAFGKALAEAEPSEFYAALASAVCAFIALDARLLGAQPQKAQLVVPRPAPEPIRCPSPTPVG